MLLVAIASIAAACSSHSAGGARAATRSAPREEVMVTMGAIETSNLDLSADRRDTWTQIAFDRLLPDGSVLADLADENVTAERVIETQLPELETLHPDIVTIWVESADVRLVTPPTTYRAELTQLVDGARVAGARHVLLLTPPAAQQDLTGVLAGSVAAVASATGATLVQLGDTSDRYTLTGQRRIAAAVVAAVGR
jgi:hypothetical protein